MIMRTAIPIAPARTLICVPICRRLGGIDQRLNGANASVGFIPSIVVTPPTSNPPAPQNPDFAAGIDERLLWRARRVHRPAHGLQLLLNQPAPTDLS